MNNSKSISILMSFSSQICTLLSGFLRRIEMLWQGVSSLPRARALLRQRCGRVIEAAGCLLLIAMLLPFAGQAGAQTGHLSYQTVINSGFTNPEGVAVDSSGDVFVADYGSGKVFEIVAVNGVVSSSSTVNTLAAPSGGYHSPQGVAVDSSGDVFVADSFNNAVYEIVAVSGAVSSSSTVNTLASGITEVSSVALDGSGNVYVSSFDTNDVYKLTANGSGVVPNGSTPVVLASGFSEPEGVAVDGNGNVFVADTLHNAVKEIPAGGGSVITLPAPSGGWSAPKDVAVDGSGNVFVANAGNAAWEIIAINGAVSGSSAVTMVGYATGDFTGLAVNNSGNIFLASPYPSSVVEISTQAVNLGAANVGSPSSTYTLTFTFDTAGAIGAPVVLTQGATGGEFADAGTGSCTTTNGLSNPYAEGVTCTVNVTFTPQYVGLREGAVELTDTSGNMLSTLWLYGTGNGQMATVDPVGSEATTVYSVLSTPFSVAVDAAGDLFVGDANAGVYEIVKGTTTPTPICMEYTGCVLSPWAIAFDAKSNLYIAGAYYNQIVEVPNTSTSGSFTAGTPFTLISSTTTFGGTVLNEPYALAVGPDGVLYINDSSNGRIVSYNLSTGATGVRLPSSSLYGPYEITLDAANNLYVTEYVNGGSSPDLLVFAPGATSPSQSITISTSLVGQAQGVVVDASGSVIVSDWNGINIARVPNEGGTLNVNDAVLIEQVGHFADGIALDALGNLYAADRASTVYAYARTAAQLSFPTTADGSSSPDQTLYVENAGNVNLSSWSLPASSGFPPFTDSYSCSGALDIGYTCPVTLGFSPTVPESGTQTGALSVVGPAPASATLATIILSGTVGPPAATPTFSVVAGTYATTQTVSISDSTSGAAIYYTVTSGTSGTQPTTSSTLYGGSPITVSSTETIEAIAVATGYSPSAAASATYTINNVLTPTTLALGANPTSINLSQQVTLTATLGVPGNNLVQNPGFETGDFTDWTNDGNERVDSNSPHTGSYDADFPSVNIYGTISQTLTTTAGTSYTLTFWLENQASSGSGCDFQVMWNNVLLSGGDISGCVYTPYTQYTFTITGTGSDTLSFKGQNNPAAYYLDDISVLSWAPINGESVTFYNDGSSTPLGTGTLSGGVATLQTTTLPEGNNSVTAFYAGDASFSAVTSSPVTVAVAGPATQMVIVAGGSPQTALVNKAFANPLAVEVEDANGVPVPGATVSFTATPSIGGASAALSSPSAVTGTSGASAGIASVKATANGTMGSYTVTASSGGLSVNFNLTNTAPPVFTVTTVVDDAIGVASNCTNQSLPGATLDSSCSLRDAMAAAAAASTSTVTPTVNFATTLATSTGSITPSAGSPGVINIDTGGTLYSDSNMTIQGPGANLLSIASANLNQIFFFDSDGTNYTVSGLTIANGNSTQGYSSNDGGGGLANKGTLTVSNCIFSGNSAPFFGSSPSVGGAILNGKQLTVSNCTFTGNTAAGPGGAIFNGGGGLAIISGSTFTGNTAGANGGAILNNDDMLVINSTFSGNSAGNSAGAIASGHGPLYVISSTFSGNFAGKSAGAIGMGNPSNTGLFLADSIVSGNWLGTSSTVSKYDDLDDKTGSTTWSGAGSNYGGNIMGYYNSPTATAPTPAINLAPLGNYGGPTQTMVPLPGSPAICTGVAGAVEYFGFTGDQRGYGYDPNCPAGSGSADSGAVQTNYAISFTTEPPASISEGVAFTSANAPVVTLTESGNTATAASGTVSASGSPGALSGTSLTLSSGVGSFSGLSVTAAESSETLTATLSLNATLSVPLSIAANSTTFNVPVSAPVVTSVNPASGSTAGGASVTITGNNFNGATAVNFGVIAASFTVNGPTQIMATSPAGTGTVDVTVTTAGGTSGTSPADQFTYVAAPTVTGVTPGSGPTAGGTSVTITGTNFNGLTAVKFGALAATGFTVNSPTQITATSPAGAGIVDVTVITPGGTSGTSPADQYTYVAPPTVTSVSPSFGLPAGGTAVTITGTNFTGATAVNFGTIAATGFTINSATQITATSPTGTGTVDVTVITAGGTSATSAADQYLYAAPAPATLMVTSGTPQSAYVTTAFGAQLQATVLDQYGNPYTGASVTFTAPSSGASATFSNTTNTITVTTDSSGNAYSGTITANLTVGGPYSVTAAVTSLTSVSFSLTNTAMPFFTVTSLVDDATGVAANCTDQNLSGATPDNSCSLRDAIAAAAAVHQTTVTPVTTSLMPTITFAATLCTAYTGSTCTASITPSAGNPGTINIDTGGTLAINENMSITGPGSSLLTVSGASLYQVFSNYNYGTTSISGLTITAGNSTYGGAINNTDGTLSLTNVAITNSTATYGGAIHNEGTLYLTNSTVSGNSATSGGGGIANTIGVTVSELIIGSTLLGCNTNYNYGLVKVLDSTIANNNALGGLGGGIYNEATYDYSPTAPSACSGSGLINTSTRTNGLGDYLSVVNSTITGNTADSGGGIYNASAVANYFLAVDSTITGNTAATGGGVALGAGSLTFQNDIDTGNTATTAAPDVTGTFSDGGGNVLGLSSGTGTSASANLAPLGNYGGSNQTMAPIPGSAAICGGLTSLIPTGVSTDQRGYGRTTSYSGVACVDAGAVQTNYAMSFTTEPPASIHEGVAFTLANAPVVTLTESGSTATAASGTVSASGSPGALSGSLLTLASGVGSFSGLSVTAAESSEELTATLTLNGALKLTATSNQFDVIAITLSPTISLVSSLNPVLLQNPVTYTATVSSTAGKPTGTVTFEDGGVALTACTGVPVTTATGVASCAVAYTAVGTHSITAAYNGDTNFLPAGPSNTVSEAAIDINLGTPTAGGGTTSSETILPGGSATYSFPIAPSSGNTFPSALTMTVSSSPALPTGTTMTVTPPAWVFTSNNPWSWTLPAGTPLTSNTLLTIQLPQSTAAAQPAGGTGGYLAARQELFKLSPFSLALLLLPFAGRLRKSGKRLGRILAVVLLAGAGMAAMAGLSGCGSNTGFFTQAQHSYTVTVTVSSGTLSHSTTGTLIVE
jgi:hypothetical protein